MRRRWFAIAGLALATLALALGAKALWGRPGWLLDRWQRAVAGGGVADDPDADLHAQVVRLNAENAALRMRLGQYDQIRGEGGFPPERVVVARGRVVGRTARIGRRYLELDVGTSDGVVRDLPVAAGWRLAGMVVGVREGRCLVEELSDSESRVPAAILDGRQILAEGVLAGDGEPGWARLDFVEPREGLRIDAGQNIVSAGSDGRLPPGLVIGTVETARNEGGSEHWKIRVRLATTAAALESLLVLKVPDPPPAPAQPPAAAPPAAGEPR